MSRILFKPSQSSSEKSQPIKLGGTGGVEAGESANNLELVTLDKVNQIGGAVGLTALGKIPSTLYPNNIVTDMVNIQGPVNLAVNVSANYTITDYDSYTLYTLVAINGTVNRVGNSITYTAGSVAGAGGFTINGRTFTVNLSLSITNRPVVISPVNGSIDKSSGVSFASSAFSTSAASDTHQSSEWQLSTSLGFTAIWQTVNNANHKTQWAASGLIANTTYYIRVRHRGTANGNSDWSAPVAFSTKASFYPADEEAKLKPADSSAGKSFSSALAMSEDGTRVVVGAYGDATNRGAAYVFLRTGTSWTQEAKLVAADGIAQDYFGVSVTMSGDGSRVVVGAYGADPSSVVNAGAAYSYTRTGSTWSQEAKLLAVDKAANDLFGYSVAMSIDGSRVVVGATSATMSGTALAGAVYVFSRNGTVWTQEAKLGASDKLTRDNFGRTVSISNDGTRLLVGSIPMDQTGTTGIGDSYVFLRTGTTWAQEAVLRPSDAAFNAFTYWSTSLSGDGQRAVVGVYNMITITNDAFAGAVYVFARTGTAWSQEAKLVATDLFGTVYDDFGSSVALSRDGSRLLVGSFKSAGASVSEGGCGYVFSRSNTVWGQLKRIDAADVQTSDVLGLTVAISDDGSRGMMSSKSSLPSGALGEGSTYVFS